MWDTFIPPNADAILNIPLRHGGCEDFLAWEHEKSGIYSVRLHYQAFVNQNERPALNEGKVTGSIRPDQASWQCMPLYAPWDLLSQVQIQLKLQVLNRISAA